MMPGIVVGSIFTLSLTLGDYIIPGAIGNSSFFIGQAVLSHEGTAGNIPSRTRSRLSRTRRGSHSLDSAVSAATPRVARDR